MARETGRILFLELAARPQAAEPLPPGWEQLLDCSYAASLDGTKEPNLLENRRAVLYDKSKKENGKYLAIDGNWNFDEANKLYAVTFNGEVTTYSIARCI